MSGADAVARKLEKSRAKLDPELSRDFRTTLNEDLVEAMQVVAPVDTGLLKELIEGKVSFGRGKVRLLIESPVRDPATNYAYTGVTRFGHKKPWLYPKHATKAEPFAPGSKTLAGNPRSKFFLNIGHAPALAVHREGRYGKPIYRAAVRGYKPAGDWVEKGMPAAERAVTRSGERVVRKVALRTRIR